MMLFPDSRLNFSPAWEGLEDRLQQVLRDFPEVYLVGGSVRDLLLGHVIHDIDLVMPDRLVRTVGRRVADELGGGFFILDEERNSARVVLEREGVTQVIDFSSFRDKDLNADLLARDFTINAMAINLANPARIIDPLGGARDLKDRILRLCSPQACQEDPLRSLRAVRLSVNLGLRMLPETYQAVCQAAPQLYRVTAERKRDELFRILDGHQIAASVRLMDQIGALKMVLPELTLLKGVPQPAPHTLDVWEHTLATLRNLEWLFQVLVAERKEESSANLWIGLAVLHLGQFRQHFQQHFGQRLNPFRSLRALLMLAGLYHDSAKPTTLRGENGKIRFIGHEAEGTALILERGRALALSEAEIQRLKHVIQHHMRVHLLANDNVKISRRTIYRFFRDAGKAGVDVCLLALADTLATYGFDLKQEIWARELEICRDLLTAWWEQTSQVVKPPRLVSGDDILKEFHLSPGAVIGRLLAALQEAQAAGEVNDRQEALQFIARELEKDKDQYG